MNAGKPSEWERTCRYGGHVGKPPHPSDGLVRSPSGPGYGRGGRTVAVCYGAMAFAVGNRDYTVEAEWRTTGTDAEVEKLCVAFVAQPLEGYTQEELAESRRSDAVSTDGSSQLHEYHDANVFMGRAFAKTFGRAPGPFSALDADLTNRAWTLARARGYSQEVTA